MQNGDIRFYNDKGELHREDGPAIEWSNGSKNWCINGKLHREDGPAIILSNGYKGWLINGKKHRVDGPAIEWYDGTKWWYLNGIRYTNKSEYKIALEKHLVDSI